MATDMAVHHDVDNGNPWEGGKAPMKASYGKLMMWYFLLSDAFTFSGFLIAYGALRMSAPSWPVPDFVFKTFPFLDGTNYPLYFVTFMSFLLIISSVTMVRAVQEGHRENRKGVVVWMILTIIGGIGFLSCQAWEWSNLMVKEHMSITTNPFGAHTENGVYTEDEHGHAYKAGDTPEEFSIGQSYLVHKGHDGEWIKREYKIVGGENDGKTSRLTLGPKAFGALFFFITGFHGFHVLSGVVFLIIIMINAASGLYVKRKNGYEMVEKIGLYWHFVDLVWVFVFLVFYLL